MDLPGGALMSLTVNPNPVQDRYQPRLLITLTIGAQTKYYSSEDLIVASTEYGDAEYGDAEYGG